MAAWDGQGRPEWGHGVNRRERRTDGTRIVYIYIYICFGGRLYPSSSSSVAVVFLLSFAMCFLFCFGSLEIITGVSLVSESSSSFESSSFPDDDVFFLSLTTLLHTPVVLFFPLFHQSAGPPPEKIVTLAGIIAPRMVREDF